MFNLTQLSKMQCNYIPYNSLEEAYESNDVTNLRTKSYKVKELDDYAKYTNIRKKIGKLQFISKLEFNMNDLVYSNLSNDASILKLSAKTKMMRTLNYRKHKNRFYKKNLLSKYFKNRLIERSKGQ